CSAGYPSRPEAVFGKKSGLALSLGAIAAGVRNWRQDCPERQERSTAPAFGIHRWHEREVMIVAVPFAPRGAFGPSDSRQGAAGWRSGECNHETDAAAWLAATRAGALEPGRWRPSSLFQFRFACCLIKRSFCRSRRQLRRLVAG